MSQQQVQVGPRTEGAGSRLTEWTTDRLVGGAVATPFSRSL